MELYLAVFMSEKRSIFDIAHAAFYNTLSVVSKEAEDAGTFSFAAGVVLNTMQILAFPFGSSSPLQTTALVHAMGP